MKPPGRRTDFGENESIADPDSQSLPRIEMLDAGCRFLVIVSLA